MWVGANLKWAPDEVMLWSMAKMSGDVLAWSVSCLPCRGSANIIHWPNVGLLLAHRLRRWPNSKPALVQPLMFAGGTYSDTV